jgi:putative transposase
MRGPRIKGQGTSYYHAMNRLHNREYRLGDQEKTHLLDLIRRTERFSGVRVLTYCLMDNHYHLLLEVPDKGPAEIPEFDVWQRMKSLYSEDHIAETQSEVKRYRDQGNEALADRVLDRYRTRMNDLSAFMSTVGQRFSQWFNRRSGRCGSPWNDRFNSVLVEHPAHHERSGDVGESAVLFIAQYIDLNPFRAGMVSDPKAYHWSGYGASVGGCAQARSGITRLISGHSHRAGESWSSVQGIYRRNLYLAGSESGLGPDGRALNKGFSEENVKKVEAADGALSLPELLRCKVCYFSKGKVIGSRMFIENIYRDYKPRVGLKREEGSRRMAGGDWGSLMSMSDVRGAPRVPSG